MTQLYQIQLTKTAEKQLRRLPKKDLRRIDAKIRELAKNPYMDGSGKLMGAVDLRRVRAGDYRIVYSVESTILVVTVVRIGHRREVYRR